MSEPRGSSLRVLDISLEEVEGSFPPYGDDMSVDVLEEEVGPVSRLGSSTDTDRTWINSDYNEFRRMVDSP